MCLTPQERAIYCFEELFSESTEDFERKFLILISREMQEALTLQQDKIIDGIVQHLKNCRICDKCTKKIGSSIASQSSQGET